MTYAQKSLLFGDETADALLEYAAMLADEGSADTVQIRAVGIDGNEVVATFMLSDGIELMAETTPSNLAEPNNTEALEYMRGRMATLKKDAYEPRPTAGLADDFSSLDDE